MEAKELPARPDVERYRKLAKSLLKAFNSGDPASMKRIQDYYQRPMTWNDMREAVQRRLQNVKVSRKSSARITLADAQLLIAHSHAFESWPKFQNHLKAIVRKTSSISRFESGADAVVMGDIATIERLLGKNPELIRARSTRQHQSTLLHYVSANGIENFRQKTPRNAVTVARLLLRAGAEVDAENIPGRGTTLGLVATSVHPAKAGVQIALLTLLLDAGASPDGLTGGWNPLIASLANGRGIAAEFLATRGARLDLEGAAGIGRLDVVKTFFKSDGSLKNTATAVQMESGFAWACQYGRIRVVDFLLKQRMSVDKRLKHSRETGLHWAAHNAHIDIVKLLLRKKSPVDAKDERFGGTPLDWALHGWNDPSPEAARGNYREVVSLLVAAGAGVDPRWFADPNRESALVRKIKADRRMLSALRGKNA